MNQTLARQWFNTLLTPVAPMQQSTAPTAVPAEPSAVPVVTLPHDARSYADSPPVPPPQPAAPYSTDAFPLSSVRENLEGNNDLVNPQQPFVIELGNISYLAAQIGNALAHESAINLQETFANLPSEGKSCTTYRACWNLFQAATTPPRHLHLKHASLSQNLDQLVTPIWNDPVEKGFLPTLDWLRARIAHCNSGALLDLQEVVLCHRDLACALYRDPRIASLQQASYAGLPVDVGPETVRNIFAIFSLLNDMILAASDGLTVGRGFTWRKCTESNESSERREVVGRAGVNIPVSSTPVPLGVVSIVNQAAMHGEHGQEDRAIIQEKAGFLEACSLDPQYFGQQCIKPEGAKATQRKPRRKKRP